MTSSSIAYTQSHSSSCIYFQKQVPTDRNNVGEHLDCRACLHQDESITRTLSKKDVQTIDGIIRACASRSMMGETIDWKRISSVIKKTVNCTFTPHQLADRYYTYFDPRLNTSIISENEAIVINYLAKKFPLQDSSDQRWRKISSELSLFTQYERPPHFLQKWYYSEGNTYLHTAAKTQESSATYLNDCISPSLTIRNIQPVHIRIDNLITSYDSYVNQDVDSSPISMEEGEIIKDFARAYSKIHGKMWYKLASSLQSQLHAKNRKSIQVIQEWYYQNIEPKEISIEDTVPSLTSKNSSTLKNTVSPSQADKGKNSVEQLMSDFLYIPEDILDELQVNFD